jgi:hypothetical protein
MGVSLQGFGESGPAHAEGAEPITIGENLGGRAIGEDGAVEENDAVGMGGGGFDIVCDQENGKVMDPAQIADEAIEEDESCLVDPGDRFVEQEDVGARRHRQGEQDALEFAAGEGAESAAGEMPSGHGKQGFGGIQAMRAGKEGFSGYAEKVGDRDGGVGIDR